MKFTKTNVFKNNVSLAFIQKSQTCGGFVLSLALQRALCICMYILQYNVYFNSSFTVKKALKTNLAKKLNPKDLL